MTTEQSNTASDPTSDHEESQKETQNAAAATNAHSSQDERITRLMENWVTQEERKEANAQGSNEPGNTTNNPNATALAGGGNNTNATALTGGEDNINGQLNQTVSLRSNEESSHAEAEIQRR